MGLAGAALAEILRDPIRIKRLDDLQRTHSGARAQLSRMRRGNTALGSGSIQVISGGTNGPRSTKVPYFTARKSAFIGANALAIDVERLTSDDMLFAATHGSCRRRQLRLAGSQDFLRHHTAGLRLSASPACGHAQHAKGDDTVRV